MALIKNACEAHLNSLYPSGKEHPNYYEIANEIDLYEKLLLYGLIETISQNISGDGTWYTTTHIQVFTNKIHRFRFWLSYNKKLPENISVAVVTA